VADTSLSGLRVARELDAIITRRGKPNMVVSDNVLYSEAKRDLANRSLFTDIDQRCKNIEPSGFRSQWKELSTIANTGYVQGVPHRSQYEIQIQAEDPNIIYEVAFAPPRPTQREVLPPGIARSKNGR